MQVWQAVVLGAVQGITEFLPISSSGHLVLFQSWFGLQQDILTFDIFLHLATLLAIVIFFGKTLFKVSFKEWMLIGVGTLPAVAIGLLFKDTIEAWFEHDIWLGWELIATGLINLYADWRLNRGSVKGASSTDQKSASNEISSSQLTWFKSFLIGIAQAVAIIPGISRSGSTVAGALSLGLSREEAFRFSFLLAIPALLGAGILEAKDVLEVGIGDVPLFPTLAGCVVAFATGWLSLVIFRYVITKAKLDWFGWYCIVLGLWLLWRPL
jgi:undecaprenyl-diphosphatase